MNYLRGALQYYKDLPPINPATLTGAIDVIAIRKPTEDGEYEIAASPFHVRFGKFQILRPGDKKVSVSVNGNAIPFPMKIGEAGEAFFLFETDEEIGEELATSPLQSPLQSPRIGPIEPTTEKFGASETREQRPDENAGSDLAGEIERLDLDDATQSPSESSPASRAGIIEKAKDLAKTVVTLSDEAKRELGDKVEDEKRLLQNSMEGNPIEFETEANVAGPEVQYRKDVALDSTGYHATKKPHNLHNLEGLRAPTQVTRTKSNSQEVASTSGHHDIIARSSSTGAEPRSGRPPQPELHLSSLPAPMEYEWDWGRFPQPSPMRERFQFKEHFPRTSSSPATIEETNTDSPVSSSADEVVFGLGGLLKPKPGDPYQFNLALDGTTMLFQLSLCGTLGGIDEVEDERWFESQRVSWRKFMAKKQIAKHDDLVILWDDKYVTREDASPLFGALLHWRDNTVSSQGYTSDGEPLSSGDELSEDENELPVVPSGRSTWSRWFGRGWSEKPRIEGLKSDGLQPPQRPAIQTTISDPTDAERPSSPLNPDKSNPSTQAKHYAKTLRLTSEQLKSLDLHDGPNQMTFSLSATGAATCTARIFLWDSTDHIVVSDIDGTITKSDALGHVFALVGRDWTHIGVAKLYTDICRNGYKIMYLTSRAIGQADSTRDYLKNINQNNQTLPEGPVIMSPDRLMASLHREVIMRKPEVFKMACLRDIVRLFGQTSRNPFYAGFGNRITDALSYRSVNIPSTRIFTIDSTGEVKTELLERAGYKSSYTHMSDLVDQQFPPIHRPWVTEYTDFNYWRQPLQSYEFPVLSTGQSPTGSRSESPSQGTLRRIRQFSLGRAASKGLFLPNEEGALAEEKKVKSMNGQTLQLPSSRSMDDRRAQRRLSGGSMPGSLPKSSGYMGNVFDDEEEELPDDLEAGEAERELEPDEEPIESEDIQSVPEDELFFEDLLATGEMKNVPFL